MNNCDVDLHMHTIASDDGTYEPKVLVDMCKDKNINIMAIADHNSVKSVDIAKNYANEIGITYIPAIEIDCTFRNKVFHVLGYGIDYTNPIFNQLGEDIEKQEKACSIKKLELTNQLGFDLKKEQLDALSSNGVYTGEMFGEVLLKDERYSNHPLLQPYREGGNRSDNPYVNFFWDFYAQGKPCYTEIKYITMEEAIKIINENHGIAVLAHPGNNLKGCYEWFDDIVSIGMQGVECYSNYHDTYTNEYFYKKAKEYNILFTCGSDFHGKTKPSIHLGIHGCLDASEIKENLIKYNLI